MNNLAEDLRYNNDSLTIAATSLDALPRELAWIILEYFAVLPRVCNVNAAASAARGTHDLVQARDNMPLLNIRIGFWPFTTVPTDLGPNHLKGFRCFKWYIGKEEFVFSRSQDNTTSKDYWAALLLGEDTRLVASLCKILAEKWSNFLSEETFREVSSVYINEFRRGLQQHRLKLCSA